MDTSLVLVLVGMVASAAAAFGGGLVAQRGTKARLAVFERETDRHLGQLSDDLATVREQITQIRTALTGLRGGNGLMGHMDALEARQEAMRSQHRTEMENLKTNVAAALSQVKGGRK